jgi:uncharacterized membrane protein
MALLAYLLPPVTGLFALLYGGNVRARLHGARSVALGVLLPAGLYVASLGPPLAVRVVAAAGVVLWVTWAAFAAAGREPRMPGVETLRRALEED